MIYKPPYIKISRGIYQNKVLNNTMILANVSQHMQLIGEVLTILVWAYKWWLK